MKTVVAISSQNKKTISKQAGTCQNFILYTIDNDTITNKKTLELKENEILKYTFDKDKSGNPQNLLFDVDILLTGGMDQVSINKLANQNVTAYIIEEKDPDKAIAKLIKGILEAISPISHSKTDCC